MGLDMQITTQNLFLGEIRNFLSLAHIQPFFKICTYIWNENQIWMGLDMQITTQNLFLGEIRNFLSLNHIFTIQPFFKIFLFEMKIRHSLRWLSKDLFIYWLIKIRVRGDFLSYFVTYFCAFVLIMNTNLVRTQEQFYRPQATFYSSRKFPYIQEISILATWFWAWPEKKSECPGFLKVV